MKYEYPNFFFIKNKSKEKKQRKKIIISNMKDLSKLKLKKKEKYLINKILK